MMDQISKEILVSNSALAAEREAVPLAHEAVHLTTVGILRDMPKGKLLDVPAGEGALAARLLQLGFSVSCCDLFPEIFRLKNVEIKRGDLSSQLPYNDSEFDYVTCVEGLEHIENPQQAIREFRRILSPGGTLVISVPNILNIEERLKWLVSGYTSHFKPLSDAALEPLRREFGKMEAIVLHVNPIGYSELRYILEANGFVINKLFRDKRKSRLWLYWPIVQLIRTVNALTPAKKRRERWADELQSDEILLGGNTLIVQARLKDQHKIEAQVLS
jgi:SAM-dependent methyltransferase